MSDEIATEVAEETTDAPVEVSAEPTESTAESEQAEAPEEQPEERKFSQKELDAIVQKRIAKEHRRIEKYASAETELRLLKEQLQTRQAPQDEPQGSPNPAQFQDYESYIAALTDWKVEQKIGDLRQQSAEQIKHRELQEYSASVAAKLSSSAEKYDDFEDVALNPNLPITPTMASALADSDKAGDLAYYLGTHLKEAETISRLPPMKQVREILKLEQKLVNPVVQSSAPKPITPLSGRSSGAKTPDQMTDKEFAEWRRKQISSR